MKTTLWNATHNTLEVLNKISDQKIPFLTSRHIFKVAEELTEEDRFLNVESEKIVNEYGAKSNENNQLVVYGENGEVDLEKTQEFIQKVIALRETEMDFAIEPFNVEELAAVEISPKDYAAISWLIDE